LHPVGQSPNTGSSPAVLAGETLYLETLAMPESGASLVEQFHAIMTRHESNLSLADMDLSNVVYADLFLSDLADESSLDALLREYFPATPPAATVIGVGPEAGAKIMVGLIAAR
jgi:enamine deaminase RidA (YjgF/YER057c/UK114 family)